MSEPLSVAFLRRRIEELQTSGLKSGDGGGTFDDMDARLKVLEYRAGQMDAALGRIEAKLDAVGLDVAEMKGRLGGVETKLAGVPSAFTILQINGALLALTIGVVFGTVSVLKAMGVI